MTETRKVRNIWADEPDWIVCLVWLDDKNDPEARLRTGDEIGYLFGFAMQSGARIMAEIGDDGEDFTIFQLLFSFPSPTSKEMFLALVQADERTRREEDTGFSVPAQSEIDDAEALGNVLPEDISRRATLRATLISGLLEEDEEDSGERKPN